METLKYSKITTLFNKYLNGTNDNFVAFCQANDYISGVPAVLNASAINTLEDSYYLNLDAKKFKNQKVKIENILKYINSNKSSLEKNTAERTTSQIVRFLIANDKKLKLDEDIAKDLSKDVVKIKRRKKHAIRNFVGKKVVAPAIVTGAVTSAFGLFLSTIKAAAGSSIFVTGSATMDIIATASIGGLIGFGATIAIISAKSFITRQYYHHRYGVSSHNFSELERSDVASVEDVKNLQLPIIDLLDKMDNTDATLRELSIEGTNFFLHPINAIKSFFLTKVNRNRLHEVVGFTKLLNSKLDNSNISDENKNKYNLLLNTISSYRNNLADARLVSAIDARDAHQPNNKNKFKNTTQLFEYSDIWAKEEIKNEGRIATTNLVSRRTNEIMERRIKERLVGGDDNIVIVDPAVAAAKKAQAVAKRTDKKNTYTIAEQKILDIVETGNIDTLSLKSGISQEMIEKIAELINARLNKKNGKQKANPSPLGLSDKALNETTVNGVAIAEPYRELKQFINTNPDIIDQIISTSTSI